MKVTVYECYLKKKAEIELPMDKMGSTLDLALVAEALGYTEFTEEHTGVFCMNDRMEIIGYHEVAVGTPVKTEFRAADVIKRAILNNATSIALVHNHPTQTVARPSDEDVAQYTEFEDLCARLGMKVLDGVVIAGDGKRGHSFGDPFAKSILVHMAENGLLDDDRSKAINASKMPDVEKTNTTE